MKRCSVPGCDGFVLARGWCGAHYSRWLRSGEAGGRVLRHGSLAKRLEQQIAYEPNTGCWLWMGPLTRGGYGRISLGGRNGAIHLAHRVAYVLRHGPVPDGLELDHLCRQRCCVNPDHLDPVTRLANVRRGLGPQATIARHRARTHCKYGHEFSDANIRWKIDPRDGARYRGCRTCERLRQRKDWEQFVEAAGS